MGDFGERCHADVLAYADDGTHATMCTFASGPAADFYVKEYYLKITGSPDAGHRSAIQAAQANPETPGWPGPALLPFTGPYRASTAAAAAAPLGGSPPGGAIGVATVEASPPSPRGGRDWMRLRGSCGFDEICASDEYAHLHQMHLERIARGRSSVTVAAAPSGGAHVAAAEAALPVASSLATANADQAGSSAPAASAPAAPAPAASAPAAPAPAAPAPAAPAPAAPAPAEPAPAAPAPAAPAQADAEKEHRDHVCNLQIVSAQRRARICNTFCAIVEHVRSSIY